MRCPQPDTNADKCHVQERHTGDTTLDLEVFDIKGSEVMVMWQRIDEQSKEITQTHKGK